MRHWQSPIRKTFLYKKRRRQEHCRLRQTMEIRKKKTAYELTRAIRRRRRTWVEPTATSKPTIGKSALISGTGARLRTSVNSSKPPAVVTSALPKLTYI